MERQYTNGEALALWAVWLVVFTGLGYVAWKLLWAFAGIDGAL